MPNLRQLEYLVAIAETRHFRRAAELAGTTQPTLSGQLKALEERLGTPLVERTPAGALLTPLGAQIVDVARRMLADAREIRDLAASGGRELAGVLRLGLPPTIGPYLLPLVIPELHRRHPDLRLYVREELPSALPRLLDEGRHDAIVTVLPIRGAAVEARPLFREPLCLAVAADHRLAARRSVARADLRGEDMLTLGPGHQLHDAVLGFCREVGARVRLDYEGTSLDMLREMVAMGLGVTFLPALYVSAVAARDESIRIIGLSGRSAYRSFGLAWRRTSARHASYEALARILRAGAASKLAEPGLPEPAPSHSMVVG